MKIYSESDAHGILLNEAENKFVWDRLKELNFKAISNKDCAEDAQSDFSSGCTKNSQAGWVVCGQRLSRIFCVR